MEWEHAMSAFSIPVYTPFNRLYEELRCIASHSPCSFHDAVELLASDSDDSMWVRLDGAHVPDSKIAKVGGVVGRWGHWKHRRRADEWVTCTAGLTMTV